MIKKYFNHVVIFHTHLANRINMNWKEVYENNSDWFDYKDLYDMVSELYEPNSIFVEIGVWQGASLSYLMLKNRDKDVYGVDTFKGDPNNHNEQRIIKEGNLNLEKITVENLRKLALTPNLIIKDSIEASKNFSDKLCSFVFIDGGHMYEQVCADIKAWLPKVKSGGILAGHDYNSDGVKKAVDSILKVEQMGNCWWIKI